MMVALKLTVVAFFLLAAQDSNKQQQIDLARQALRDAEGRLAQLDRDFSRVRDQYNLFRNRANLLSAEADRLQREALALEKQLVEGQYKLTDAHRRADAATAELNASKEKAAPLAARVEAINEKIAGEKARLLSEFEQSPELAAATEKVAERERERDAAIEAATTKFATNAEYKKLR